MKESRLSLSWCSGGELEAGVDAAVGLLGAGVVRYVFALDMVLRRISCHGRIYSQPYFFKRNQSSDNRSHGFGAKFLLKKLSASDFSYERKSAFSDL